MTDFKIHNNFYRNLVFWVGVLSTIFYRLIIFLNRLPTNFWSDIFWYAGTLGFIWYFAHRYNIERNRSAVIKERHLEEKIANCQSLSAKDRQVAVETLKSLESSKAQWNYIVIFVASGLALLIDIIDRLR